MQEVLLIALVVLLFFGGRKIPELMKGIGKRCPFIQGRYERHGERNQSRKYRQERGVTWQRKTKRTA